MSNRQVFIVSPIGAAGTEVRRRADQVLKHIIIPSMIECGFKEDEVVRADTISNPGAITHQITSAIINADLVIADLTDTNANVFYELAIRHVLRRPYVQICDINTTLPFDVKDQRTIMFDFKDLDSVAEAKVLLVNFSNSALNNPDGLMTPIHEGLVIEGLLNSEKPSDQVLGQLMEKVTDLSNQVIRMNLGQEQLLNETVLEDFKEVRNKRMYHNALGSLNKSRIFDYIIGDLIDHEKWGRGEIIDVRYSGVDTEIHVEFKPPIGKKRLLANFASIKLVKRSQNEMIAE